MDQALGEAPGQNQTETKWSSEGHLGAFGGGTRPSGLQPSPLEQPLFIPTGMNRMTKKFDLICNLINMAAMSTTHLHHWEPESSSAGSGTHDVTWAPLCGPPRSHVVWVHVTQEAQQQSLLDGD